MYIRSRYANFGMARCLFSKAITRPFYRDGEACTTILVEMLIRRTTAQQGCYDVRGSGREKAVGTAEILIANLSRNLCICIREHNHAYVRDNDIRR